MVGQDVDVNTAEEEVGLPSEGVSEGRLPKAMSAEERVMKRKKGSSPPTGGVDVAAQVGSSAAVGKSSEEKRFVTSFPLDFLAEKSTLWLDAETLLFPAPMQLLEKKSDLELVNESTEMTLKVN